MPLYFNADERYAKIQYQLDPDVVKEVIAQNFTDALYYNISLGCSLFGKPTYFEANFTAQYEFYSKLFNVTAYTWNSTLEQWGVDRTVSIRAVFESAFNFTETDMLRSEFEEQTSDPVVLNLAMADLYDTGPQTFTGIGSIEANLKRTSPLYYSLVVEAEHAQLQRVFLERTVQINFRNNQPYALALNFDGASPLQVDAVADTSQNALLALDAPMELGGLTNVSVYLITNAPPEKKLVELSKDQLDLRLLKTLNLTMPQEQVQAPPGYADDEQNAQQFYQYYTGYGSVYEGVMGFCGQTQIAVQKDQNAIALTQQEQALLYIEATNVWGTTFHQIIAVQPYSAPKWDIPFTQATIYLAIIVIIAITISFVIHILRVKQ